MTVREIVLDALHNAYVVLPRAGTARLADDITRKVLAHLHETGALSVPPEDIAHDENRTP